MQHSDCYGNIIQAAKGSIKEKKLASGFITKFFRHFPTLHDAAIDAILDLIEDEESQVSILFSDVLLHVELRGFWSKHGERRDEVGRTMSCTTFYVVGVTRNNPLVQPILYQITF